MLRIKKKHLGKNVKKGALEFNLTSDLSQKELKYIQLMVASEFVEEYTPKVMKDVSDSRKKPNK